MQDYDEAADLHATGQWCWCHPTLIAEAEWGQVWKHRRLDPESVASRVLFVDPRQEEE